MRPRRIDKAVGTLLLKYSVAILLLDSTAEMYV